MARRKTQEEFITESKEIFGDQYSYNKVNYINLQTDVILTCKEHGDFKMKPRKHLHINRGCPICKGYIRTTERFIFLAEERHGNTYDYSSTIFLSSKYKVKIICEKHGEFKQYPAHHLKGCGCPKCGTDSAADTHRFSVESILKRMYEVHGGFYSYPYLKEEYVNVDEYITIKCPRHGKFKQTPNAHKRGARCPKCAREKISDKVRNNPTGWSYSNWEKAAKRSKRFEGFKVYIIKLSGSLFKIGRTFLSLKIRLKPIPYENIEIISIIEDPDCKLICKKEKEFQSLCKPFKVLPDKEFNGMYECFSSIDPIIPLLK